MTSPTSQLFVALQRLLPAGLLGRLFYRVSRWQTCWLKNLLIGSFAGIYRVDTAEAAHPVPAGYPSLNAFFTRTLKPGSRPIDQDTAAFTSPVDGTIQQIGGIRADEILQAKGLNYRLDELLGGDEHAASRYRNGLFVTMYLAPHNYHRVHAPLDGNVETMVYVPGARMAVNRHSAAIIPSLFATNERLACHCRGPGGLFCVVLVGAMNVACISTAWSKEVIPRQPRETRRWQYTQAMNDVGNDIGYETAPVTLAKGDYLGRFELGSTVIVLLPRDAVRWDASLRAGSSVRMGERLGTMIHRP